MRRKSTLFIVLGVLLLLAAGGVAAMSFAPGGNSLLSTAAQQEPTVEPPVPVVVAQLDIPQDTLIDAPEQFLSISEVPASQFNPETHFNDLEALRDMVAVTDIIAGDTLRKSDVREAGLAQKIPAPAEGQPQLKAFPLQVNSLSGVADLVQPGDFVDVLGSFPLEVTSLYNNGQGVSEKTSEDTTTKMLLQDVEVLDVIKAGLPTEGEESAEPTPAPQEGEASGTGDVPTDTLNAGNWLIVLAVTNEEAEILRFTLNEGINLTTVLRRTGDHATDQTTGSTLELLVEQYGLPLPGGMLIKEVNDLPAAPASSSN